MRFAALALSLALLACETDPATQPDPSGAGGFITGAGGETTVIASSASSGGTDPGEGGASGSSSSNAACVPTDPCKTADGCGHFSDGCGRYVYCGCASATSTCYLGYCCEPIALPEECPTYPSCKVYGDTCGKTKVCTACPGDQVCDLKSERCACQDASSIPETAEKCAAYLGAGYAPRFCGADMHEIAPLGCFPSNLEYQGKRLWCCK